MSIRLSNCCKNCALLLSTLILIACQPPEPANNQQFIEVEKQADSPIIFGADSVTMASDYILSIKTSRYQPSLGLQGIVEPIKQSRFVAADNVIIEKILVTEGQWVEEGMPLLIVKRQPDTDKATNSPDIDNSEKKTTGVETETVEQPASNQKNNQKAADTSKAASSSSANVTKNVTTGNTVKVSSGTSTIKVSETVETTNTSTTTSADEKSALTDNNVTTQVVTQNNQDNKADDNTTKSSQDELSASTEQLNALAQPIIVRASFSGRVDKLHVKPLEQVDAHAPLLRLNDDKNLRFIATLPIKTRPQLSVGQTVNFTAEGLSQKFVGQVSKLVASIQPDELQVYVNVVKNEASRNKLKPNMLVTGRVNYGQIEVGTILPEYGIHDVDLSVLKHPPYQSLVPLKANIWVIKQDQRLTRQPVEVIKYDPSTKQYLVAGISNDSLICLADLPKESAGKKVIVS